MRSFPNRLQGPSVFVPQLPNMLPCVYRTCRAKLCVCNVVLLVAREITVALTFFRFFGRSDVTIWLGAHEFRHKVLSGKVLFRHRWALHNGVLFLSHSGVSCFRRDCGGQAIATLVLWDASVTIRDAFGRDRVETDDTTVQRLVQHEDHFLRQLHVDYEDRGVVYLLTAWTVYEKSDDDFFVFG